MCERISGEYLQAWPLISIDTPLKHKLRHKAPGPFLPAPSIVVQKTIITMKKELSTYASDSRLHQYGSDWMPILHSIQNGGYNIYHKDHNFSKQGNGGYAEKVVGMVLAVINGRQVEFLPEKPREGKCPDLQFDGYTWDVKFINEANEETIRKCIRNGRKAHRVLFYWHSNTNKLEILKSATARELGNSIKRGEPFSGIYYLNAEGLLQEIKIKKLGVTSNR